VRPDRPDPRARRVATQHRDRAGLFNGCVAHCAAAWDHSAMMRAREKLANFEIGQEAG